MTQPPRDRPADDEPHTQSIAVQKAAPAQPGPPPDGPAPGAYRSDAGPAAGDPASGGWSPGGWQQGGWPQEGGPQGASAYQPGGPTHQPGGPGPQSGGTGQYEGTGPRYGGPGPRSSGPVPVVHPSAGTVPGVPAGYRSEVPSGHQPSGPVPDHPAGTAWPDPAAGPPFGAPDGAPQRGQDPPTAVQPAVGPWQQPTDVVPPSPPGWGAPGREHVRSTGPVDQVPVPPALRPGRGSGPADAGEGSPRARDRAALTGLALAALALVVLQVGLSLRFDDGPRLWEVLPTWSAFATVAVLLLAVPVAARSGRAGGVGAGTAWQVAAGGVACLAAFWVLVVLPFVASDRGFTLTAALALAAGALWLSPGRTR